MSDQDYSPPRVWHWEPGSGGQAFNISSKPPATIEWGQGLALPRQLVQALLLVATATSSQRSVTQINLQSPQW